MQLKGLSSPSPWRVRALRLASVRFSVFIAFVVSAFAASVASGADTPIPATEAGQKATKPEDTSTKRVTLEMAAYKDSDHITVFSPSISGTVENVTAGASIHGSYLVDMVSAASVDIVSTASRRWKEVRHAGTFGGEYKPHDLGISVGGSVSSEPDYLSIGAYAQVTYDLNEKNTTLLFGYGYGHDTAGRGGTPFSVFSRELQKGSFSGGITQIINRSTVGSLALDLAVENGDQSKPYRYIPMFTPQVAPTVSVGASIDEVTAKRSAERPLEQLPLSRRRLAMTGRLAHRFDASTVRLEERGYYDTWGLMASTTDVRWIFDITRRVAFWPHARFHAQSEVSFWKRAYVSDPSAAWNLPEFRTGDRELSKLRTLNGGGGIKWYFGPDAEPQTWAISFQGDVMYTSFFDALYLTDRTGFLGSLTLEGEL